MKVAAIWFRDLFGGEYVDKLEAMLSRVTPSAELRVYTEKDFPDVGLSYKGWWNKGWLFSDRVEKPCLYLDLDVVLLDDVSCFINDEFSILKNKYLINKYGEGARTKDGKVIKHQSSVMYLPEGKYTSPSVKDYKKYRGDQDWLGDKYPNAYHYPDEWWDTMKYCKDGPPKGCKIVLGNSLKNHEVEWEWMKSIWTL